MLMNLPSHGLVGMQKVSLPGYSLPGGGFSEVDQQDDFLMMWRDVSRLATELSSWSQSLGFGWTLELEGGVLGTIDDSGRISSELSNSLEELLSMAGGDDGQNERDRRIENIDRKHIDRW